MGIRVTHESTNFNGTVLKERVINNILEYYVRWDYDGSSGWYAAKRFWKFIDSATVW